ncbi:PTS sugar transporter subunit IIA [Calorimonas adulescens]|uniref:PTS sugar transporter subunit IIA n=1 Tax=Calorimonas adulescens TaxID=2606906 RepID=A0A5D8QBY0_9THEO|nr:PTS sugar transporter subunit IIA [Calorimonas adulescens]TZE81033.1 PTS sugar transporter subunit IIA [Calorimonas adulescens]
MLDEDLILINFVAKDKEELLEKMASIMTQKGLVKKTYIRSILEREKTFPTGLPADGFGIAIPHTYPDHVEETAMVVATLKDPIRFHVMGSPDNEIDVKIVFMLAVKDPNKQIQLLKNLMNIFQDREALQNLIDSNDKKEVLNLLSKYLNI